MNLNNDLLVFIVLLTAMSCVMQPNQNAENLENFVKRNFHKFGTL